VLQKVEIACVAQARYGAVLVLTIVCFNRVTLPYFKHIGLNATFPNIAVFLEERKVLR